MKCDVCGNDYDKSLEINYRGSIHHFDCFECAIHAIAPKCASCGLKVIGHGSEVGPEIYCSAHCARAGGKLGISDRVPIAMDYGI